MNLPLCSNADLSDEGGASGGGASGDGASADGGDGGGREGDGGDLSRIRLALQLYAACICSTRIPSRYLLCRCRSAHVIPLDLESPGTRKEVACRTVLFSTYLCASILTLPSNVETVLDHLNSKCTPPLVQIIIHNP
jgi:hypothetical protein